MLTYQAHILPTQTSYDLKLLVAVDDKEAFDSVPDAAGLSGAE